MPLSFFAQETVSGTITESATGLPVPGVNVILKGTSNGTTTDFDGNYTLSEVNEDDIIVFPFLGFMKQEITFTGQNTINVQLDESASALEEVVLIGYGATTKQDVQNSATFSNLKLRAGYGVTGNQEIGPNYGCLGVYTPRQQGANVQFGQNFVGTLRPEGFD